MNFKIYHRSHNIWNIQIFLIFSFIFLYLVQCLYYHDPFFSSGNFLSFCQGQKLLLTTLFVTMWSVHSYTFFSTFLLIIYFATILMNCFSFLFPMDRLIFFMIFFYILLAYLIYLALPEELQRPEFNPLFSDEDWSWQERFDFPLKITSETDQKAYHGQLTNWGDHGCFILLSGQALPIKGKVLLEMTYEGKKFAHYAHVVVSYGKGRGVGLTMEEGGSLPGIYSWTHLMQVLDGRGLLPKYLASTQSMRFF